MTVIANIRLQGFIDEIDREPAIAALNDGGFALAWASRDPESTGRYDIFVQSIGPTGTETGPAVRLQGMSDPLLDDYPPVIAPLSDGGFVVVWRAQTSDGQDDDIFLQRFDAEGAATGGTARMQGMPGLLPDRFPDVIGLADGGFAVAWQGDTTDGQNEDIFVQTFAATGVANPVLARLQGAAGNLFDWDAQMTALPDGGFVVAWRGNVSEIEGFGIFVQQVNADGTLSGSATHLQGGAGAYLSDANPHVATLADGGYVVTWQGQTLDDIGDGPFLNTNIFAQRFDAGGAMAGGRIVLEGMDDMYDANARVAGLAQGGFVIAWQGSTADAGTDIFVQRFDAAGIATGTQTRLQGVQGEFPGAAPADTEPQLIALTTGGYAVVWTGDFDGNPSVNLQTFEAGGTPLGAPTRLLGTNEMGGADLQPDLAALPDGRFAVTWTGDSVFSRSDIFAQAFNADGTPYIAPLMGSDSDDVLNGTAQDDLVLGQRGDDTIYAGSGNDTLDGNSGNDLIFGDAGDDTLIGRNGEDDLRGGGDDDYLRGLRGDDTLRGQAGDDLAEGGLNQDLLIGGSGNDTLRGEHGQDLVYGGNDDDRLEGGSGSDTLHGEDGNDRLFGGAGRDFVHGGDGDNFLTGGQGNDVFVFADWTGSNRIFDFEADNRNEQIDFSAVTEITSWTDLVDQHMVQTGNHVTIDNDAGLVIRIDNTALADLDQDDFLF